LADQKTRIIADGGDASFIPATVNIERYTAFDLTELPAINVKYGNTDYGNQDVRVMDGNNYYFIDFHARADETDETPGMQLSNIALLRLMGMVRFILSSGDYPTLGFPGGVVLNRSVQSIGVFTRENIPDALSETMGRMVYAVRAPEQHAATGTGVPLQLTTATFTFIDSNQGLFYQYIIP
jgi:hypothetical protein